MGEGEQREQAQGMPTGSSPDGQPLPDDDAAAIEKVADRFFEAVARADGEALWEVFSDDARAFVLNLAIQQGMAFDLATAIRDGSAAEEERSEYLTQLVEGIRLDLRSIDLGDLTYEMHSEAETDKIRVSYLVEVAAGPDGGHRIPAGSLLVVREQGRWVVDRLIPRPT